MSCWSRQLTALGLSPALGDYSNLPHEIRQLSASLVVEEEIGSVLNVDLFRTSQIREPKTGYLSKYVFCDADL